MILTSTMGVGGAERILAGLATGLREHAFSPVVCCLYEPGVVGDELRAQGVEVVSRVMRSRRDLPGFARLVRLLRSERVDVLYMNNQPVTQMWGTLAARIARTPVVATALHFSARESPKNRRANRLTGRWIHLWIAISETQKRRLTESEGVPASGRIAVVPNGVDVERFAAGTAARAATRAQLGVAETAPVAGIVAGLRPEKNHSLFLRAARRVLDRRPEAGFLVVGDGERRTELEREAGAMGLGAAVRFLGIRSDTPELMGACDAGVLCSTIEALPVTLLEFMSCGRPVVSTDVGAVREIVRDEATGLVVPSGDEAALAEAILRLFDDPELASRMGAAGRAHVGERFSLHQMVARTEEELVAAWKSRT